MANYGQRSHNNYNRNKPGSRNRHHVKPVRKPTVIPTAGRRPRSIAAAIITQWLQTRDFPDRMLPKQSDARALIQEMVYGVSRWKRLLETIIENLVERDPDLQTKAYLMVGLYQIFLMDNIPPHAAANETVEAAKADLEPARIRFLNGVLRNSLRNQDQINSMLAKQPLAVRTSHPDILVNRWTDEHGDKAAKAICEWNNLRPMVTLKVNHHRTTTRKYIEMLAEVGIEAELHPADAKKRFLILPPGTVVPKLPGYRDGLFSIQDPATMLAVDLLAPQPGMRVLDACAAPGGKTFAIAELMHNKGVVVAGDLHDDRLLSLRENAARMAYSCVKIIQADATKKAGLDFAARFGPFDRILLDVPCSNTGVLRRRPDARWRFSEVRLRKLSGVQARMLNACAHLLAPDGELVYSTCSLEPEENELRVERWAELHPDFKLVDQVASVPPDSQMDGAFAAKLVRA
jgi:16S rRNA (cytosine967-C5)-methyltransferase